MLGERRKKVVGERREGEIKRGTGVGTSIVEGLQRNTEINARSDPEST